MEKILTKVIAGLLVATLITGVWLLVMWALWSLWGWVLPQVYPTGPTNLIAPGFWLFAGAWTLVSLVGRAVFGSKSKSE